MLIYAIGDVHGMAKQFETLLGYIDHHADGRPHIKLQLGDLCDRGPNSRWCFELARQRLDKKLLGNHELLMWQGLMSGSIRSTEFGNFLRNGGETTLASYGITSNDHLGVNPLGDFNVKKLPGDLQADLAFIEGFDSHYETDHHFFVHAGLDPRRPDERDLNTMVWIRYWQDSDNVFPKHIVYGHSISRRPDLRPNSSGLDTGCFAYGQLTCGVFDSDKPGGPIDTLTATGRPADY